MKQICCSWIEECELEGNGAVIRALSESIYQFDEIHLFYQDFFEAQVVQYEERLALETKIVLHPVQLNDPESYQEIYQATERILRGILSQESVLLHYHINSGNAHMATVAILLGKTIFPGELYQSYLDQEHDIHQIYRVDIPLSVEEDLLPALRKRADQSSFDRWRRYALSEKIMISSEHLKSIQKIAAYDLPVLILGEPGTEKQAVAKMIHQISDRKKERFIEIDCYGDFGNLSDINGATLYFNELSVLTFKQQQVLLQILRGYYREKVIDCRLIVATDQKTHELVSGRKLREELYYMLSVATIKLSPLRERQQILIDIAEILLDQINREMKVNDDLFEDRYLSPSAQHLIRAYRWPGNVDELYQTLRRVVLWGDGPKIDQDLLRKQMIDPPRLVDFSFEELSEAEPIQLDQIVNEVKRHYIKQALKIAGNNKTRSAKMLGYKSHQSLDYDINKLDIFLK